MSTLKSTVLLHSKGQPMHVLDAWQTKRRNIVGYNSTTQGNEVTLDTGEIMYPREQSAHSAIKADYVLFQVYLPIPTQKFKIEFIFLDISGFSHRVTIQASSTITEVQCGSLSVSVPINFIRNRWLNMVIDINSFINRFYARWQIRNMKSITISRKCRIRNVVAFKRTGTSTIMYDPNEKIDLSQFLMNEYAFPSSVEHQNMFIKAPDANFSKPTLINDFGVTKRPPITPSVPHNFTPPNLKSRISTSSTNFPRYMHHPKSENNITHGPRPTFTPKRERVRRTDFDDHKPLVNIESFLTGSPNIPTLPKAEDFPGKVRTPLKPVVNRTKTVQNEDALSIVSHSPKTVQMWRKEPEDEEEDEEEELYINDADVSELQLDEWIIEEDRPHTALMSTSSSQSLNISLVEMSPRVSDSFAHFLHSNGSSAEFLMKRSKKKKGENAKKLSIEEIQRNRKLAKAKLIFQQGSNDPIHLMNKQQRPATSYLSSKRDKDRDRDRIRPKRNLGGYERKFTRKTHQKKKNEITVNIPSLSTPPSNMSKFTPKGNQNKFTPKGNQNKFTPKGNQTTSEGNVSNQKDADNNHVELRLVSETLGLDQHENAYLKNENGMWIRLEAD
ncbi:hypothetical protein PCE1_001650 [Barthelona sp. PCE]